VCTRLLLALSAHAYWPRRLPVFSASFTFINRLSIIQSDGVAQDFRCDIGKTAFPPMHSKKRLWAHQRTGFSKYYYLDVFNSRLAVAQHFLASLSVSGFLMPITGSGSQEGEDDKREGVPSIPATITISFMAGRQVRGPSRRRSVGFFDWAARVYCNLRNWSLHQPFSSTAHGENKECCKRPSSLFSSRSYGIFRTPLRNPIHDIVMYAKLT